MAWFNTQMQAYIKEHFGPYVKITSGQSIKLNEFENNILPDVIADLGFEGIPSTVEGKHSRYYKWWEKASDFPSKWRLD